MKNKQNILVYLLLLTGMFSVLTNSCKKDDVNTNTFTDSRDGTVYKTVKIGNQVWMAENLKYLPSVVEPETGSASISCYYVYDYDGTDVNAAKATSNYKTYGVLYNWIAAVNACPTGWHLPTDAEWTQLTDYLGGAVVAGGKLKETGTTHWDEPNTGATNETGFSALPGGWRSNNGSFYYIGSYSSWWVGAESYMSRGMRYSNSDVTESNANNLFGLSVRCVKD